MCSKPMKQNRLKMHYWLREICKTHIKSYLENTGLHMIVYMESFTKSGPAQEDVRGLFCHEFVFVFCHDALVCVVNTARLTDGLMQTTVTAGQSLKERPVDISPICFY